MTKLKLDVDDLSDGFFDNSRILGIVSTLRDYQLCWSLNNSLHFDLRINNGIEIIMNKKARTYYFSVYQYNEPAGSLVHYIYNNRYDGEFLLPEFRHLDYLWLMKGDIVEDEKMEWLSKTAISIEAVQMVTELPMDKLKNKDHLIF